MTVLTVYPTNLASTTLATANQLLANVTGASNTTRNTKVGTSTGYGELWSQGNAAAWAAAGSIGTPSDHGWLLDSTLLEGSTIPSGNWTPTMRGALSIGTATADIIVRFYRRSSGGVYTAIGTITLAAQALSTTTASYPLAAASLASADFAVGDKLYWDAWLNITANSSGSAGATFNCSMASSSTQGSVQILATSPGYSGTVYTATATLGGVGALTTTANANGAATLGGTGVMTAAAQANASATLAALGTLSTSAQANAAATLAGLTTMTTAPALAGIATLGAVGTLTTAAQAWGAATMGGTAPLVLLTLGGATLSGVGRLVVDGYVAAPAAEDQPYRQQLDPAWHLVAEFRPSDMLGWAKQYTFGNTATFNGEVETYLPANVFIDSATGDLVLEGRNTGGGNPSTGYGGKYTSGMVASYNAVSFKYGYLEGKLWFPGGKGVWPAFWMLLTTYPASNEYDIVEIFEDPTILHRGIHYENPANTKRSNGGQTTVPDMSQGYHYFGLKWTPAGLSYYYDGALIFTASDPNQLAPDVMYILFNLALGGIVTSGIPADSQFPVRARASYIRLWQRSDPAYILNLTPQAPAFGNYKTAILNYRPTYYYRCDEQSGTVAVDQSGNGNNGTYASTGVTLNQIGLIKGDVDKAVRFDGSTGYLATPLDPAGLTKLSILATFNMPVIVGGDGRFIASGHTDANNQGIQMVIRGNGAGGLVSVGWGTDAINTYWSLANGALLQTNTVYHYGFSFDGQNLNVYLNGALIGNGTTGATRTIASSGYPINIGRGPYGNDYTNLVADEIALFPNVALAATDFAALYARATTAPVHAPVATTSDAVAAAATSSDSANA